MLVLFVLSPPHTHFFEPPPHTLLWSSTPPSPLPPRCVCVYVCVCVCVCVCVLCVCVFVCPPTHTQAAQKAVTQAKETSGAHSQKCDDATLCMMMWHYVCYREFSYDDVTLCMLQRVLVHILKTSLYISSLYIPLYGAHSQKRPTLVSKETYTSVKSSLLLTLHRTCTATLVSKETYTSVKRDLH
jgi:hypothetical protein